MEKIKKTSVSFVLFRKLMSENVESLDDTRRVETGGKNNYNNKSNINGRNKHNKNNNNRNNNNNNGRRKNNESKYNNYNDNNNNNNINTNNKNNFNYDNNDDSNNNIINDFYSSNEIINSNIYESLNTMNMDDPRNMVKKKKDSNNNINDMTLERAIKEYVSKWRGKDHKYWLETLGVPKTIPPGAWCTDKGMTISIPTNYTKSMEKFRMHKSMTPRWNVISISNERQNNKGKTEEEEDMNCFVKLKRNFYTILERSLDAWIGFAAYGQCGGKVIETNTHIYYTNVLYASGQGPNVIGTCACPKLDGAYKQKLSAEEIVPCVPTARYEEHAMSKKTWRTKILYQEDRKDYKHDENTQEKLMRKKNEESVVEILGEEKELLIKLNKRRRRKGGPTKGVRAAGEVEEGEVGIQEEVEVIDESTNIVGIAVQEENVEPYEMYDDQEEEKEEIQNKFFEKRKGREHFTASGAKHKNNDAQHHYHNHRQFKKFQKISKAISGGYAVSVLATAGEKNEYSITNSDEKVVFQSYAYGIDFYPWPHECTAYAVKTEKKQNNEYPAKSNTNLNTNENHNNNYHYHHPSKPFSFEEDDKKLHNNDYNANGRIKVHQDSDISDFDFALGVNIRNITSTNHNRDSEEDYISHTHFQHLILGGCPVSSLLNFTVHASSNVKPHPIYNPYGQETGNIVFSFTPFAFLANEEEKKKYGKSSSKKQQEENLFHSAPIKIRCRMELYSFPPTIGQFCNQISFLVDSNKLKADMKNILKQTNNIRHVDQSTDDYYDITNSTITNYSHYNNNHDYHYSSNKSENIPKQLAFNDANSRTVNKNRNDNFSNIFDENDEPKESFFLSFNKNYNEKYPLIANKDDEWNNVQTETLESVLPDTRGTAQSQRRRNRKEKSKHVDGIRSLLTYNYNNENYKINNTISNYIKGSIIQSNSKRKLKKKSSCHFFFLFGLPFNEETFPCSKTADVVSLLESYKKVQLYENKLLRIYNNHKKISKGKKNNYRRIRGTEKEKVEGEKKKDEIAEEKKEQKEDKAKKKSKINFLKKKPNKRILTPKNAKSVVFEKAKNNNLEQVKGPQQISSWKNFYGDDFLENYWSFRDEMSSIRRKKIEEEKLSKVAGLNDNNRKKNTEFGSFDLLKTINFQDALSADEEMEERQKFLRLAMFQEELNKRDPFNNMNYYDVVRDKDHLTSKNQHDGSDDVNKKEEYLEGQFKKYLLTDSSKSVFSEISNSFVYDPWAVDWSRSFANKHIQVAVGNDRGSVGIGESAIDKIQVANINWGINSITVRTDDVNESVKVGVVRGKYGFDVERSNALKSTSVETITRFVETATLSDQLNDIYGQKIKIRKFQFNIQRDFSPFDNFEKSLRQKIFMQELAINYKTLSIAIGSDPVDHAYAASFGLRNYRFSALTDIDAKITDFQGNWGRGWQLVLQGNFPDNLNSEAYSSIGFGRLRRGYIAVGAGIGSDGVPSGNAEIETSNLGFALYFLDDEGKRVLNYAVSIGKFSYTWESIVVLNNIKIPLLFRLPSLD